MEITLYELVLLGAALVVFLAMLSIVYRSLRNGISPMPASAAVRRVAARELASLLAADGNGRQGVIVEAGSGWGNLACALAPYAGGRPIIGVENSLLPLVVSRLALGLKRLGKSGRSEGKKNGRRGSGRRDGKRRLRKDSVSCAGGATSAREQTSAPGTSISYVRGDLYAYPYETADAVVCYLYPGAMKRLDPLLAAKLRPGAAVISLCFALPNWTPVRTVVCSDLYRTKVYVYRVGSEESGGVDVRV